MSTVSLKQRYASKWRVSVQRELIVYNILQLLLPEGFVLLFTGVGSGLAERTDGWHTSPLNAFDFTVFRVTHDGLEPVAFIDVTGYRDYSAGLEDPKPCILLPKLWKAEKYKVVDRVWFVHFVDSRVSLRVINAARVKTLIEKGLAVKRHLYSDEKPYICIDQRHWAEPRALVTWLKSLER